MPTIIILCVLLGVSCLKAQPFIRTHDNVKNHTTVMPSIAELRTDQVTIMAPPLEDSRMDTKVKEHIPKDTKDKAQYPKDTKVEEHLQLIPSKTQNSTITVNGVPIFYNHTKSTNDTEAQPTGIGMRLSATLLKILAVMG